MPKKIIVVKLTFRRPPCGLKRHPRRFRFCWCVHPAWIHDGALLHNNARKFAGGLFAMPCADCCLIFCCPALYHFALLGSEMWSDAQKDKQFLFHLVQTHHHDVFTHRIVYESETHRQIVGKFWTISTEHHKPRTCTAHVCLLVRNIIQMINRVLFKVCLQ